MHSPETKRNCTRVRVTGIGSAVKMALEDVFERMEVPYQTPQRSLVEYQPRHCNDYDSVAYVQ